jgi:AcrR family transcriptional regulator
MARRPKVDTSVLVRAAADLVNTEGVAALSLSRLAEQLGVRTPSLYNHVDGLPGLQRELALLSARGLGDRLADAAIGKSGLHALTALADAYRAYVKENPGVYTFSVRPAHIYAPDDVELQTAQERIVAIGLAVMASLGKHGDDALHAVRALRSVVHGFATLEAVGGFGLPLDCDESFRRLVALLGRGL